MLRTVTLLAAVSLVTSAAAADELDRAFSNPVNCERPDPGTPNPKQREPGLLSFEAMGLCRDRILAYSDYWYRHCADCGLMQRWDDRLQIWRQQR